jgi:hypothetical protein
MSLSKPFFNSRPSGQHYQKLPFMTDAEFKALHWTEQLRLRPLRDQKRYVRETGDFDTRNDNWDDPEGNNYETKAE